MRISITPKNITTDFNIDLIAVKYETYLMDVFENEANLKAAEKDWRAGYCIASHPFYRARKDALAFALRDVSPCTRQLMRITHEYQV